MTPKEREFQIARLAQELTIGRQLASGMLGHESEELEERKVKPLVMLLIRLGDIDRRHNALIAQTWGAP